MGTTDQMLRVPFAAVNLAGQRDYREGWVRHHLYPMQCLRDRVLGAFLTYLRDDGFDLHDFRTNGMLLPALPSASRRTGLPLHVGGHPNYNRRILCELHAIRDFCESIRAESRRRRLALAGVLGLQRRVRAAINKQRCGHVDQVALCSLSSSEIGTMIDRLAAARHG